MERHKRLYIFVISLIVVYYLLTKLPLFPDQVYGYPTKKAIKGIIGLSFAVGGLYFYFTKPKAG